jgi:CRISPR-associated protein Cmr5
MTTSQDQQTDDRSHRQFLEQERGREAWKNIQEIKNKQNESLEKEYRSLARGLNAMIQINGLGQTLGFLKAKGKSDANKAHYLLLKHLTKWMRGPEDEKKELRHFSARNIAAMKDVDDGLLRWVIDEGTTSADYRRATTECLAFGAWLRRFAEGELKEPGPGEEQV